MTIPSVVMCRIQSEDKKFDGLSLNDIKGQKWLETVKSFRYEPLPGSDCKPYTVRKESTKSGDYWYGYRKMGGKLHKKYIGKTSEISTPTLDSIGEELNTPPQPRATDKITEVTDRSNRVVTDKVTDTRDGDRLTALELQVQALQESLEALRSELPGKSDAGSFEELPAVTGTGLQNALGNLQAENQTLRQELEEVKADRAKLLESSSTIKSNLERKVQELRSQLAAEETRFKELDEECDDRDKIIAELRSQLAIERVDREEVEKKLEELQENSDIDFDFAGKAGELVSWLRKTVGKALPKQVTVKEVQKILEGSSNG